MAEPILLDRFRDNTYSQNQILNDKLDLLIGEMRDMKQDIRALDKKIETVETNLDKKIEAVRTELKAEIADVRTELKAEIADVRTELKAEIDKNHAEFKSEINTARWQVVGVVIAQICSIGAITWAVVSALK